MPKYQIIIPSWNQSDLCCRCLETIREHSSDYEVIFVDNASDQEHLSRILPVLATMPHKLLRNTVNTGFIRATNQGLYMLTAKYAVLMNNDTEAVPGWLSALEAPLKNQVGASGPLTTAKGSWQGREKSFAGVKLLHTDRMLAFFCTMIRADVIARVGELDTGFGVGFGDDDDYCRRIHDAGYRLALVGGIRIPHHHRSTFKQMYTQQEIARRQTAAYQILVKKRAKMACCAPAFSAARKANPRFAGVLHRKAVT